MTIDEFSRVDLRIGQILFAERVAGSAKLVKLFVDLGEKSEAGESRSRQIVAGIGTTYAPEELLNQKIVVVANLEPRQLMGLTSEGMLLAASDAETGPVLLTVVKEINPGAKIK